MKGDPNTQAFTELGLELLKWLEQREPDKAKRAGALAVALGMLCCTTPRPLQSAQFFSNMIQHLARFRVPG